MYYLIFLFQVAIAFSPMPEACFYLNIFDVFIEKIDYMLYYGH